jgi:hypothetical protein
MTRREPTIVAWARSTMALRAPCEQPGPDQADAPSLQEHLGSWHRDGWVVKNAGQIGLHVTFARPDRRKPGGRARVQKRPLLRASGRWLVQLVRGPRPGQCCKQNKEGVRGVPCLRRNRPSRAKGWQHGTGLAQSPDHGGRACQKSRSALPG